jgi:ankyrin repeat protein
MKANLGSAPGRTYLWIVLVFDDLFQNRHSISKKCIRLLLAIEGVEVDCKDGNNRTPLSWAVGQGHGDILIFLLEVMPTSR